MNVDMRCPACNRAMQGDQDIVSRGKVPIVRECPHCGSAVIPGGSIDVGGTEIHFFKRARAKRTS